MHKTVKLLLLVGFIGTAIWLYYLIKPQSATINKIDFGDVTTRCQPRIEQYRQTCATGRYRYALYRCFAGDTLHTSGGPTSCKTQADWRLIVQDDCQTNYCAVMASPTPLPSGCQWVATQCLVAPCPSVLQCASPNPSVVYSPRPSATTPPKGSPTPTSSIPPKETPTPTPTPVASDSVGGGYSPKPSSPLPQ